MSFDIISLLSKVVIVTSSALTLWRVGLNTAHELSRLTGAEIEK